MSDAPSRRLAVLDYLRGIAVMGILVANLPAFGLPEAAYFSPLAYGGTAPADIAAWLATYVLVEGKMRALFSLLFGASLLLVHDRAERAGDNAVAVQLRRLAVLFVIGCLHLYLVWRGDILAHYALCGIVALAFTPLPPRWLVAVAAMLALCDLVAALQGQAALDASAARDTPAAIATWNAYAAGLGVPPRPALIGEIAALRGSFLDAAAWRWHHAPAPLAFFPLLGAQTLSAMLLGMAAYRSGFLAGTWPRHLYRRTAAILLTTTLPLYALAGAMTIARGFDQRWVHFGSLVVGAALRLPATIGYAALFIVLFRRTGRASARIAAVGQAAFSNYLGTSLVMMALFTGAGAFARLSRAELYLLAPPVFAAMLLWSGPWLAVHRYGPLEWAWRTLARGKPQPWHRDLPLASGSQ